MLFAPASASFRIPMICSSVNRFRFIAGPPRGHPSRADSHAAWTSFRGAGRVRLISTTYYNAGMPHWLARLDHNVLTRSLEIFLWARTRLNTAGYGSEISCSITVNRCCDTSSASRAYLNRHIYEEVVSSHRARSRNFMNEINLLVTLKLIQRLLLERDYCSSELDLGRKNGGRSKNRVELRLWQSTTPWKGLMKRSKFSGEQVSPYALRQAD